MSPINIGIASTILLLDSTVYCLYTLYKHGHYEKWLLSIAVSFNCLKSIEISFLSTDNSKYNLENDTGSIQWTDVVAKKVKMHAITHIMNWCVHSFELDKIYTHVAQIVSVNVKYERS